MQDNIFNIDVSRYLKTHNEIYKIFVEMEREERIRNGNLRWRDRLYLWFHRNRS